MAAIVFINIQLISSPSDYRTPLDLFKNIAHANSENDWKDEDECDNRFWDCDALWQELSTQIPCTRQVCYLPGVLCDTFNGTVTKCIDGPDFVCWGLDVCNF